jgi:hypothetical protein
MGLKHCACLFDYTTFLCSRESDVPSTSENLQVHGPREEADKQLHGPGG